MKRVYYLETVRVGNTDTVKGIEYIHQAILGVEGTLRKLIQDTTNVEHNGLTTIAKSWRDATDVEIAQLASIPKSVLTPTRDLEAEIDNLNARIKKLEKI